MEIDYRYKPSPSAPDENFRIASMEVNKDYQFGVLTNFREADSRREVHVIFGLDEEEKIASFDEIFFNFRRSDKSLTSGQGLLGRNEPEYLVGQLRKMLPPSQFGLYLPQFLRILSPGIGKGVFTSMELIFKPESLKLLQGLSPAEISEEVDSMTAELIEKLKSRHFVDYVWFGDLEMRGAVDQARNNQGGVEAFFSDRKMNKIKTSLSRAFSPNENPDFYESQWAAFKELRNSVVFRDLGSGYLVRLLEKAVHKNGNRPHILDLFYLRITVRAEGQPTRLVHAGQYQRPEYTEALIERRDRILNRNYSLQHFLE